MSKNLSTFNAHQRPEREAGRHRRRDQQPITLSVHTERGKNFTPTSSLTFSLTQARISGFGRLRIPAKTKPSQAPPAISGLSIPKAAFQTKHPARASEKSSSSLNLINSSPASMLSLSMVTFGRKVTDRSENRMDKRQPVAAHLALALGLRWSTTPGGRPESLSASDRLGDASDGAHCPSMGFRGWV